MKILTLLVLAMLSAPGGRALPGECEMRSVNFRDNVLWAIAEKDGLDPTTDLLNDIAREYVSSINAWLRRLYDVADFAEWTDIQAFTPDPTTHLISWDAIPSVLDSEGRLDPPKIGKVLKVYLLDPRTTWTPVDTPFRETKQGIYVGFEHGPTVWLKFIPRVPVFTSEVWDSSRTYRKGELTYSPSAGECYKSKVNNNRGHDPSDSVNQPLPTEITQERTPDDPGLSVLPKIMDVDYSVLTPDPNGTINYFSIYSDTPPTPAGAVANVVYNGTAGQTATQIRDGVLAALIAEPLLASYTFTAQASPVRIRVQKAEDFSVFQQPYSRSTGTGLETFLKVTQVQGYIPGSFSSNLGSRQFTTVAIGTNQVKTGATYLLTFTDDAGQEHEVSYTAVSTDNAQQIIVGLINAIQTAKTGDAFFNDVFASLDLTNLQLILSVGAEAGLDAQMRPAPTPYWTLSPFPFALVDQVVRGVYADVLKTEGQADKGAAEEQSVPQETQLRIGAGMATGTDMITDQTTARGRYGR
jgi:hypothetical protein